MRQLIAMMQTVGAWEKGFVLLSRLFYFVFFSSSNNKQPSMANNNAQGNAPSIPDMWTVVAQVKQATVISLSM